ncbi:MAG: PAS domain S-box protein [Balneolaceae bacterium]|jgi:PAS domain S-box-containing protein
MVNQSQKSKSGLEIESSIKSFEELENSVITLDLNGRIINWNREAENIFGYSRDEILGEKLNDLFILYPGELQNDLERIKKGKTIKYSWKEKDKDEYLEYFFLVAALSENQPENAITASIIACRFLNSLSLEKSLRLAAIVSSSDDAIIGKNLDGTITSWNRAAEKIYGYSEEEALGQHIDLIIPERKKREFQEIMRQLKKGKPVDHLETKRKDKKGREIEISLSISPIKDDSGNLIGASAIARDITTNKQLESEMRQNQVHREIILDNVSDGILSINGKGIITTCNKAVNNIFGYKPSEIIGRDINMLFNTRKEHIFPTYFVNINEGEGSISINEREMTGKRKEGSIFPLSVSINEIFLAGEKNFICVMKDLTKQRKLEQKIVEVSQNEQMRLASYLHDNIGQTLSGLRLMSLNLSRILTANGLGGADEVKEISELIHEADGKLRDLARGLVASGINADNLEGALKQLKLKTEKLYDVQCDLNINSGMEIREKNIIQHIYRIAQEAIRNSVMHGKADTVKIVLDESEKNILLQIIDNGRGFSRSMKDTGGKGIGITTMKYRAQLLGGQLNVTDIEKGAQITCEFPNY